MNKSLLSIAALLHCCMVILLIATGCSTDKLSPSHVEPENVPTSEVEDHSLTFEFTLADIPQRDGMLVFEDGAHFFTTMDAFHDVPDQHKLVAMRQAGFDSYLLRYMEALEALDLVQEEEDMAAYQDILHDESRFITETLYALDPEIGFKYYSALPLLNHEGMVYVGDAAYLFDSAMGQVISYKGDVEALRLAKETKQPERELFVVDKFRTRGGEETSTRFAVCEDDFSFATRTKSSPTRRVTFQIELSVFVTGFSPNMTVRTEAFTIGRSFKGGNYGYKTFHYWDYDFVFTNWLAGLNGGRAVTTSGVTSVKTKWRTDITTLTQLNVTNSDLVFTTPFISAFYDRTGHSHRGMDASRADRWAIMQPCE